MCYAVIAFCAAAGIAFVLVTIWQCSPIAAFWNRTIPGSHCFHSEAFWFSYSLINIVTDVIILALPIRQIFALELASRDKWGLVGIFSLGTLYVETLSADSITKGMLMFTSVCVTSIIRTTTLAASANGSDPTCMFYIPA